MRVLVTGAYGFIGSAIVAHLVENGHEVVGAGRRAAAHRGDIGWVEVDFARVTRAEDWLPHLAGIEAVVNCVGLLQDTRADSTHAVHVQGTAALFEACERADVRRVVHLSAIGVDRERPTGFSRTKFEAEQALMARDLDWVILRPSVVLGRAAYGGSALLRGLAGLPGILPVMPDTGPLQVVQLDDVVSTVVFFLRPEAPARQALDLAGPERLTFTEVVLAYRTWLGLPKPHPMPLPRPVASLLFRCGDALALLGWRPPVRTTAERELTRGAVGDPAEWTRLTGIAPRSLAAALAAEPAPVQERWFARLYFVKPLVFGVLSIFWLVSGFLAVGPGYAEGEALLREGGVVGAPAVVAIIGGGLLNVIIGLGIAFRRTSRISLYGSIVVSVLYAAMATVLVPRLWIDPLGPLVKIVPILVLTLAALAIRDDR